MYVYTYTFSFSCFAIQAVWVGNKNFELGIKTHLSLYKILIKDISCWRIVSHSTANYPNSLVQSKRMRMARWIQGVLSTDAVWNADEQLNESGRSAWESLF